MFSHQILVLQVRYFKKRCLAEKNHFGNEIMINDEILSFISNEFKSSIRDMLGVLNRIIASARIQNKTPTLQDAKLILKDLLNNMQSVISIEDIQKIVVAYYNLSMNDFYLLDDQDTLLVQDKLQCIYQKNLPLNLYLKLEENLRVEIILL